MVSRLPPALESSLSLPLLSSRPHSWPEKATQRAGVLATARHPQQLGGGGRSGARAVPCSGSALSAGGGRGGGLGAWGRGGARAGRGNWTPLHVTAPSPAPEGGARRNPWSAPTRFPAGRGAE